MRHTNRSLLRTLFAVPVAAALLFGATQALASPPEARLPNCGGYCDRYEGTCLTNPSFGYCQYCGCGFVDR